MRTQAPRRTVRRRGIVMIAALALWIGFDVSRGVLAQAGASYQPDCNDPDAHDLNCTEPTQDIIQSAYEAGYPYYIGHAEPSALFFSTTGTSGSNMQWKFQLPATEPSPTQNGSSIANFELYSTFWLGLALCDPNSKPYGSCVAVSDSNNPNTAGAAFLELQFFPPGINCSNTQWCVYLHINTLEDNNATQKMNCIEPTTAQYVTTNGTPGGPKLLMSNGDSILVTIHDTSSGLETDVNDLTSSKTGSMVASGANGFVHNSDQTTCATTAFDFHAMYATASPGQVVPWAQLGPNVAIDFEIGHFELCGDSACSTKPDGADTDDTDCANVRGVGGCFGKDSDQDGVPYQANWPDGTGAHPATLVLGSPDDRGVGPLTTSVSHPNDYDEGYKTIQFATTESTSTTFYPFFSQAGTGLSCRFNFGNDIPNVTTNDFGKAAQYGTTIDNPCLPGTAPNAVCKNVTVPTDLNLCSSASASIDDGSADTDGDPVSLSQSPAAPYPLGTTLVTLKVTEPESTFSTCTSNITVFDPQVPNISCPSPVAECTGPSGAVVTFSDTVTDNCPGVLDLGCAPASGTTFPLGSTPFTCNAKDGSGNTNACSSHVVVQDTTPPTVHASLQQTLLWPPDHGLVNVGLSASVSDVCDPNPTVGVMVFGDEDDSGQTADGTFSPDAKDIGFLTLRLREERKANSDGRVYLIIVKAKDASGNVGSDCGAVAVARDDSATSIAIVMVQAAAARAFCLANNGTAPPGFFVIGDGPILGPMQ